MFCRSYLEIVRDCIKKKVPDLSFKNLSQHFAKIVHDKVDLCSVLYCQVCKSFFVAVN